MLFPRPNTSPSAKPALLGLINNELSLWKLIMSWPAASGSFRGLMPEDPLDVAAVRRARDRLIKRWSAAARVPVFETRHAIRILFGNGFLTEDGGVDPLANTYVTHKMIEQFPKAMRDQLYEQMDRRAREVKPEAKP